jgi:hypothetical protein
MVAQQGTPLRAEASAAVSGDGDPVNAKHAETLAQASPSKKRQAAFGIHDRQRQDRPRGAGPIPAGVVDPRGRDRHRHLAHGL